MQCPRCQARNRRGRRFCAECGAPLALSCASCGFSNEPRENYCSCGLALTSADRTPDSASRALHTYTPSYLVDKILPLKCALVGERKQVTVLFADLKGSTELIRGLDPEAPQRLLDPALQRMMDAVHRFEGTVNQVLWDGIMVLFGAAMRAYTEDVRRAHGLEIRIRVFDQGLALCHASPAYQGKCVGRSTMTELKLISADSHVNEPGDLWVERIDKAFRERAPRIVENPPGQRPGAYLILEGMPPIHMAQGIGAGKKPEELPEFFRSSTYKDVRPGGWDPAERLKDMDLDGVEAEVIYTTLGFRQFWLEDAAFQRACFQVYNDWLAEYCAYAPKRLIGLAMVSLYDIDEAVRDLRRCAKQGLRGAMIWCSPPQDRPYSAALYEPFWAEAQELNMPISLHSITGAGPESRLLVKDPMDRYLRSTVLSHEVQRSFTTLIFSGVLERFPRLKFVSAENEVGWLTFFLQKLDQAQDEYQYLYPSPLKMKPSEYFQRQCYATFIDDPVGVATRQFIGVSNIMWSSDYPHTVSTWPHSQEVVERDFQGVPESEKRQIVRGNAVQLYGLDLP